MICNGLLLERSRRAHCDYCFLQQWREPIENQGEGQGPHRSHKPCQETIEQSLGSYARETLPSFNAARRDNANLLIGKACP